MAACIAAPAAPAGQEQKFEALVLRTHVTLCQFKPRGCAGYMVVATERPGKREQWTIQIPLGVPIRRGEDYVLLASLGGSTVSVTYVSRRDGIVAQSIEVIEARSVETIESPER